MKFPNPFHPPPAPPGFGAGKVVPETSASPFSRLIFHWVGPFLGVGFSRPLQKDDFWSLPQSRTTASITDNVETNFFARCPPETRPRFLAEKYNLDGNVRDDIEASSIVAQDNGEVKTEQKKSRWFYSSRPKPVPKEEYDSSLFKALHHTFFARIWVAGFLKLFGDTLKTTTPLINKVLLTWLTECYVFPRLNDEERAALGLKQPRGIGYGIGLAVALFAMQEVSSLLENQYMQQTMSVGLSIRTGVIGNIFRKSLRLSGRARAEHSVGQITTMISTDATKLDLFSSFAHYIWIAPIQLIIGIGLLIGTLGYSALVGLGVIIFGFPVQLIIVKILYAQYQKAVEITDKRVRLTTETLQGIRLIKFYAWEGFYALQIGKLRLAEIGRLRRTMFAISAMITSVSFVPMLATILSFITYSLSGHDLNIAIIFTSLQFFNIIRTPLTILPFVLSSFADAVVSLQRISKFLVAEELAEPYKIDHLQEAAVNVEGDFAWETVFGKEGLKTNGKAKDEAKGVKTPKGEPADKQKKKGWWAKKEKDEDKGDILPKSGDDVGEDAPVKEKESEAETPFELHNLKLSVPKGSFVAIVGRVGSGKSSILQALIGEMRRTKGNVTFGGSVAYVAQTPWIRNATLRENIVFGQTDVEDRFRAVVHACSLDHDLDVLPHGEATEIGEKGINLSGGQKARVSLARAAYSQSDVVLLDDPLSAVDSHVGKSILENCLLNGPLASRTRILVTHALHVLDKTDYIYVMDNGTIVEQGTYPELMADSIVFSRLIEEHGNMDSRDGAAGAVAGQKSVMQEGLDDDSQDMKTKDNEGLMQSEEREIGAVPWEVYRKYLRFAGGIVWAPVIISILLLTQGAQVATTIFLGFWTVNSVHGFKQGDYMAVYAGLGVVQAILAFFQTFVFAAAGLIASLNLFNSALSGILRSPISFFDTTPMGRILSRLSKDQNTLDQELSMVLMQLLATFSAVFGTIALVFYTFPLLGIIFVPMVVLYYFLSIYYRRSSVETKRLDSLMRSALYASYSETLTGLSTIRAYREQARSVKSAEGGLDMENRAYYMTISIQRWLAVRLDFFGNILVFGIALFAAGFRTKVDPSKVGVVLSYTLSITQVFAEMISQFAQNEQNMNAVERVLHYAELPQEGRITTENDPPPSWPSKGEISFTDVELAYREGLPLVLKGVSFRVTPGEKIGIVGRTGAGKSSLLQALFRVVELQGGDIKIDEYNIRDIGLDTLRTRIALVPQDTTLFLGTLRQNLDPFGLRTDAELISALQRAWLLPRDGSSDPVTEAKFSLDSVVGDEGSNFSVGEKQLLALCRALVKNSRIIILDEATSNVDVETDAKIQQTIQREFASSTLLCIAHRLNTIAYYDRVLVMDAGEVAEYDTVLNLFDREDSLFRSLCNEAKLQRSDILRIRADHSGKC